MALEELFGGELLKQKETIKTSSLEGKYLMVYFSAHWCGPCRSFTPSLVKFYNEMKSKRDDFDLIFVSSDRDQHAFDEYYGEMPWLALPFSDRDRKGKLSEKYKVRGIPTLVVLGKDGSLITDGARSNVMEDPQGEEFPWIPPTLEQLLGESFVNNKGEKVEKQLKGKIFGLYFSAHWCPPCQRFTPILIEKYKELIAQGKDFELVFVSSDRDQHSFDEYFGEMPWLAIPFTDKKRAAKLSDKFEVEGIPTLVIIDTDLSTITREGVEAVSGGLEFPYRPLPLNELSPATASSLNESPSLILFCDEGEAETMAEMIRPMAEEYTNAKKGVTFYYTKSHPIVPRIREFAHVAAEGNVLLLLDIPSQKKAVSPDKVFTAESVKAFVDSYLEKKLTMVGIKD